MVACPTHGAYSARVRQASITRAIVAILLLTRLVFGEFAHAHDNGGHALVSATASESSHCADHAEHQGAASNSTDADGPGTTEPDCCKMAKCACACVHAPAAAMAIAPILAYTTDHSVAVCAVGATADRPFKLFRPPA